TVRFDGDLVVVGEVMHTETGHGPYASLERLGHQALAVLSLVAVQEDHHFFGDTLFRFLDKYLAGAQEGSPHHAAHIVAGLVLAQAVQLHAAWPRTADRWAEGRILPHA